MTRKLRKPENIAWNIKNEVWDMKWAKGWHAGSRIAEAHLVLTGPAYGRPVARSVLASRTIH